MRMGDYHHYLSEWLEWVLWERMRLDNDAAMQIIMNEWTKKTNWDSQKFEGTWWNWQECQLETKLASNKYRIICFRQTIAQTKQSATGQVFAMLTI